MSAEERDAIVKALKARGGFETRDGLLYFGSTGTIDPDKLLATLAVDGFKIARMSEAELTQIDATPCVCQHPRSDHGDGVVHTACCAWKPITHPRYGQGETTCNCKEFTPVASESAS